MPAPLSAQDTLPNNRFGLKNGRLPANEFAPAADFEATACRMNAGSVESRLLSVAAIADRGSRFQIRKGADWLGKPS
jgi:hypothetical protein